MTRNILVTVGQDKAWFEQNPWRRHRIRPSSKVEEKVLPSRSGGTWNSVVREVEKGLRLIQFVHLPVGLPAPEGNDLFLHCLFDEAEQAGSDQREIRPDAVVRRYRAVMSTEGST